MPIPRSWDTAFTITAVPLVTTAETLILSSPAVQTPKDISFVLVRAWSKTTWGVGATSVTPRIRRGNALTGAAVGDATAVNVTAAQTSEVSLELREERDFFDFVQYSLTLAQVAATANGSTVVAHILVMSF